MRFHFSCTRNPHTEREVYTMRTPRLRLLSALLAVALFFTLLPVSALAEDSGSNANTGLTISIVGEFNNWDPSNITMKEVSPAVYEVTIENTSYDEINVLPGFKFIKDHTYADQWGSSVTASSGELHDAVYYGDNIMIDPGSDDESAVRNFIVRLDLTNWDWGTITGATFTITVTAPSRDFTFDATTGTIKKYNGNDTVVVIPPTINSWPVTKIGEDAFQDNTTITSVTIPASVTEIGSNAFVGCTNLTIVNYEGDWSNLTIQSGNPAVQDAANEQLFDFEFILNNTAVIVNNYNCKGTAADVTIPSCYKGKPVTAINNAAFPNSAVTSVTIPDSVTSIPDAAFYNCGNLETIHIPVSVTFIGSYAFADCPSLMTVTYSGSKTQWDKITGTDELPNNPLVCNKLEATFNPDNGEPTVTKFIDNDKNSKFAELVPEPTKENYTFAGWYKGDEKYDFSAVPTDDVTLTAKWTAKNYEVSFITEHGKTPTSQNVPYNGTAADPGKLSAEGYTFIGWYTDHTCTTEFDFSTPITGDTKVYAKWEKNAPVLPDTYELNVSGAFVYVDGVDVTAAAGDTTLPLEKDASVRLVADPDRMPSGMVFDRWTILNGALNADDAEKFETGRTLEDFAFTMPAEPLSIEATPRMQEEEGSDTVSVIAGVTLGTAATALVAWQAYDLGMSLYQEHWLPADFVMPKTRAELALLLWNTAGRPAPAAQPAFTDITDPDTAQAAQWAVETGLMTPKSADRFKPEKSVTRWKAVRSWKRVTNQNT